jgi:hypothetical protein
MPMRAKRKSVAKPKSKKTARPKARKMVRKVFKDGFEDALAGVARTSRANNYAAGYRFGTLILNFKKSRQKSTE